MDDFKKYTKNDDLNDETSFKLITELNDEDAIVERAMTLMTEMAREMGVNNFVTLYKAYEKSKKKKPSKNLVKKQQIYKDKK